MPGSGDAGEPNVVRGTRGGGLVVVMDTNSEDCNGDGIEGDFDGDYDSGIGGAFFGYGPWANEPICGNALKEHYGYVVAVYDLVFFDNIWFRTGADDTYGPDLTPDPVDGSPACTTSGSITPGDPATDPTADPDDCLSDPQNLGDWQYHDNGRACGAGGDGGYWVFLLGAGYVNDFGWLTITNPPTTGNIHVETWGDSYHEYVPNVDRTREQFWAEWG